MPVLITPDPDLPPVITMDVAQRAGLTPGQVRHRLRSGRWTRIGRGAYMSSAVLDATPGEFERAELVHRGWAMACAQRHPGAVIGYQSGAVLHGLPLWGRLPTVASLIVPRDHWTGSRGRVRFRSTRLLPQDRVILNGTAVTSVARTWCDIARTSRLATTLAVGDAALRTGKATLESMTAAVQASAGLHGVVRAERSLTHLSALRETALESASWAYFVRHGLPLPRMQVVIVDDGGNVIARVDFLWEEFGLVGECDGRIKYSDRDALYSEKRREDAIRQRGLGMVRWGSPDLTNDVLARRLRLLLR